MHIRQLILCLVCAGTCIEAAMVSRARAQPAGGQHSRYDLVAGVAHYAHLHQLPPTLVAAVVHVESGANPCAVSSAGAAGLMQLTAPTAHLVGVTDRYSPDQSLAGGTAYLADALKRAKGDVWRALGVYNWSGAALTTPPSHWPDETLRYAEAIHRYLLKARDHGWRRYLPSYVPRTSAKRCTASVHVHAPRQKRRASDWLSVLQVTEDDGTSP